MSITIKTTGLEDYLEGGSGRLKFLLVGPAGGGKTRFSAFAPKPIYADTEDGLLSVADRSVPYASIKSEADMDAFLTVLEAECKKPAKDRRWETVVVDTIDTFERNVITSYLKAKKRKEMDGWEDWGHLSSVMTSVIARLMLLPMNVIVLCHTKDVKRKGQIPEDQVVLRLKGDLGQQLPNDFDFIGMIETEFAAVEGSREIVRTIRWESTPAAPWLKFRGGGVKTTPLTFSESDFDAIRDAIRSRIEKLEHTEVIQTVPTSTDTAAVEPTPGVALPVSKKATAPAPAPSVAKEATPARIATAPVPAAPKPDLSPPVSEEQAIENVQNILGGQVVEEDAATPVVEPEVAAVPEPAAADNTSAPEAPEGVVPDTGDLLVRCGDVRFTGGTPVGRVPGCGKEMDVTLTDSRVTAVRAVSGNTSDLAQLVEMAGIREGAFLCNACFASARRVSQPA